MPVTLLNSESREVLRQATEVQYHPEYNGNVHFQNSFHGKLPATDYPKVTVRVSCFPNLSKPVPLTSICLVLHCHVLCLHSSGSWLGVPVLEARQRTPSHTILPFRPRWFARHRDGGKCWYVCISLCFVYCLNPPSILQISQRPWERYSRHRPSHRCGHIRRGQKLYVILFALGCITWPQRRSRILGTSHDSVSSPCRIPLHFRQ